MKIIGLTLITKGILGLAKAWSLATRGILDRLRLGAEQKQTTILFDKFIHGKKEYKFELEKIIVGRLLIFAALENYLKARKSFDYKIIRSLIGKEEIDSQSIIILKFNILKIIEQEYDLKSQVIKDIFYSQELYAQIIRSLEYDQSIEAQKLIVAEIENYLEAQKEFPILIEKKIKGRKDITPILEALE